MLYIFKNIFDSLNRRYSFKDPQAIEVARKISQFYFREKNYYQSNAILQCILPLAVKVWGNEHIITKRLREDYDKNNEKIKVYKDDNSKVLFNISLLPHNKSLIYKAKQLFINK